jgi:hypothetical protein
MEPRQAHFRRAFIPFSKTEDGMLRGPAPVVGPAGGRRHDED